MGLMGLGDAAAEDQDPISVGAMAQASPVLSTASVTASSIMLRMAAVPRDQRLNEMVSILNAGQPGLGESARADFFRRSAAMGPRKKDQAMFDAIRAALADALVSRLLALRSRATSGLGQTFGTVSGRTSQGVEDANAIMCSTVMPAAAMVGGFMGGFGVGGSGGQIGSGVNQGAQIAGCNAGQMVIQGQIATDQARLAQSGQLQTLAMQQAADARFTRYALVGAGLLGVLGLGYLVIKKA
jgi:hypothetical protein